MTQPCPLALDQTLPDPAPVSAKRADVWPHLPAEGQQQALLLLAQMLLKALAQETGHDQPR